jgi:hypothetical protein
MNLEKPCKKTGCKRFFRDYDAAFRYLPFNSGKIKKNADITPFNLRFSQIFVK